MQDPALFSPVGLSKGTQADLLYAINAYTTFIADRLGKSSALREKFSYRTQTFQDCLKGGEHLNCVLMLLKFICDLMSLRDHPSPIEVSTCASPTRTRSPLTAPLPRKATHSRTQQSESSFKALIEESQKLLSSLRAGSPTEPLPTAKLSGTELSPSQRLKADFGKSRSLNFSPDARERLVVRTKRAQHPAPAKAASPQCRLSNS